MTKRKKHERALFCFVGGRPAGSPTEGERERQSPRHIISSLPLRCCVESWKASEALEKEVALFFRPESIGQQPRQRVG